MTRTAGAGTLDTLDGRAGGGGGGAPLGRVDAGRGGGSGIGDTSFEGAAASINAADTLSMRACVTGLFSVVLTRGDPGSDGRGGGGGNALSGES